MPIWLEQIEVDSILKEFQTWYFEPKKKKKNEENSLAKVREQV